MACFALADKTSSVLSLCWSPGPGSELFSLHPHTGELHTAASLVRAERPHYVLTLSAHDQGSPPRSASLQLLVQVGLPSLESPQGPLVWIHVLEILRLSLSVHPGCPSLLPKKPAQTTLLHGSF